ncbi:MAG: tyrosine--tRNA ligase, partial [Bacteroidota bacterium]
KFGKTESGNVWLDPERTSPYTFYQFWVNVSDEDAAKYIKIFTMLGQEEINSLVTKHAEAPHLRLLQKRLAQEITCMVHGEDEYNLAQEATQILFGKGTTESLASLPKQTFLAVFDGVPRFSISRHNLAEGIPVLDLLALETSIFSSKGEARKMIQGGGVSINKSKIESFEIAIDDSYLLNNTYILIQRGKKNNYIIEVE